MLPVSPRALVVAAQESFAVSGGQNVPTARLARAMMAPPARPARRPVGVTPPFVPGGTGWRVVMRTGGEGERMPSSEERVSAHTAAYWAMIPERRRSFPMPMQVCGEEGEEGE